MANNKHKQKVSEQRQQQVLSAIDRIAGRNELAFLTTRKVCNESKISDGVLFRHFSSKEAMLSSWVELRTMQLYNLMAAMPAGKRGLQYFLKELLQNQALLTFMCCQPMDVAYLRLSLETSRQELWQVLYAHINLLADKPNNVSIESLTDHLFQCIYRTWNPNNPHREKQKEKLMTQLPWDKKSMGETALPAKEVLQRLALNDSGFVFDPVSGLSFTANPVALFVLRHLQHQDDLAILFETVETEFDVSRSEAERDLTDFFAQIRKLIA
ncbi:MAG: PqqD family peptide modification chaperone [Ghiorsea sp.]|nr:PqqD family peptide modification chaperone [Ghiorsea sp.]